MRWLFADPNNPTEAAQVREKVAAIDQWWQSFQAKASDLEALFSRRSEWDLPSFMEDTLQGIDPRLMWEYGRAVRQAGHRLVITPESERWLRPMVRTILERAPKIAGWEFYPYRLAEMAEQTIETVEARVGVKFGEATIEAHLAPGRKVDLQFCLPPRSRMGDEKAVQAAFVATETLMGEQVLDTWIGQIRVTRDDDTRARALPLDRAQATVAALIRGAIEQLPAARREGIAAQGPWSTVGLEPPEPQDDYPARSDVHTVTTLQAELELVRAIYSGQPFSSSCHSRCGETFCYLKLDFLDVESEDIVGRRAKFEDVLQPALTEAGLGCVMGGGSGLRYAYIDLALTDIRKAAPLLRRVLGDGQAPERSWLLFNDDDYGREWLGAYPETPPPPHDAE